MKNQRRFYPMSSLHHLLFLVYIIINLHMTILIKADQLPISTLSIFPTLFGCALLYTNHKHKHDQFIPAIQQHHTMQISPPLTPLKTNTEKLCYLHAWQSSPSSSMRILRFSSNAPICIDTGASCCISNDKKDFVNFTPSSTDSVIHGISSGLKIAGTGTITWTILNDDSDEITIHIHDCLYVPDAPMCLLSPQHMASQTNHPNDGFLIHKKFSILTFSGFKRTIHYNTMNNLPIIFKASNLSTPTIEHHASRACIHGKQRRHPAHHTPLDIDHLEPGDCVSGDQVESSSPGLIPVCKGKPASSRYHAGTLFVDHASRFIHFTRHISSGCKEALQAKHEFESIAQQHNRNIKCYLTDHGIFASKEYRESCLQQKQCTKFCGVNAHHQNGIAERHIRAITEKARTMLIHAMIQWPDIINETLWPFALRLAVELHNKTPGPSDLTPEEIFTGIK
jgi:hypothetical protein